MSSTLQNLIAVLGILIIGGIGYYLYIQNANIALDTVSATSNEASREAAEFLSGLNELRAMNLDDSLFNDSRFRSLSIFELPVTPVPVGRENPFSEVN
jgi:hypothetical protein